jgi:hypothetical protein
MFARNAGEGFVTWRSFTGTRMSQANELDKTILRR